MKNKKNRILSVVEVLVLLWIITIVSVTAVLKWRIEQGKMSPDEAKADFKLYQEYLDAYAQEKGYELISSDNYEEAGVNDELYCWNIIKLDKTHEVDVTFWYESPQKRERYTVDLTQNCQDKTENDMEEYMPMLTELANLFSKQERKEKELKDALKEAKESGQEEDYYEVNFNFWGADKVNYYVTEDEGYEAVFSIYGRTKLTRDVIIFQ